MKIVLLIILLAVLAFVIIRYIQPSYEAAYQPQSSACPAGTTYAIQVTGGWVATSPSDPQGSCVQNSQLNASAN